MSMSEADMLRRAADVMQDYGDVHGLIAAGLRKEAKRIDDGEQFAADAESLSLARAYLGGK